MPSADPTLTLAIIGHLVGDFLLQNDWMALNKKKRSLNCAVHCAIWTLSVCAFTGWWTPIAVFILFTTHFIQDRTNIILWWMTKMNRQQEFVNAPYAPWSVIVVDNVWHIVTLWVVWRFAIPG